MVGVALAVVSRANFETDRQVGGQGSGHRRYGYAAFTRSQPPVDCVDIVCVRVGDHAALGHVAELGVTQPPLGYLPDFLGLMSDTLVVKGVHQNPPGRVIHGIHHVEGVIEGFDLGDRHIFETGSHPGALRMNTQVFVKMFGHLAVGLRADDQAVFGAHFAPQSDDLVVQWIGLATRL